MLVDNRYFVEKSLGEGGSGKVYKVLDKISGEIQALKVLNPDQISSGNLALFEREFLNLKKLSHPNIIRVYNFGFYKRNQPYFTMDYIDGPPLMKLFQKNFELKLFVQHAIEICLALDYLHDQTIIHRDLKPANILLKKDKDGHYQAVLTDFGMADNFRISHFDPRGGSHFYVSPEAIKGWKIDQRSDLYSLGVTLYEIATGRKPFSAETPVDVLKQHLHKTPDDPSNIRTEIPFDLSRVLFKLLEKEQSARYSSASKVIQDLLQLSPVDIPIPQLQTTAQIWGGGFVGRKAELKVLQNAFEAGRSQQNLQFVLVNGDRGIGKTRLLQEFSTQVQLEGGKVFSLNSSDTKKIPYGLIVEMIRQIGVFTPTDVELSEDEAAIWRFILTSERGKNIPIVFENKAQIFDVFVRLLERFTAAIHKNLKKDETRLPLLVILDDFQSASKSIHEFIRYLLYNGSSIKILLTGIIARDVVNLQKFYRAFQSEKIFHWLDLNALNQTDFQAFLSQKFTRVRNFDALANDLCRQTSGNPLYTEYLLQYLIDKQAIVREGNNWLWKGMGDGLGIPGAITELFRSRWDKLEPAAQFLMQAIVFHGEAVLFSFLQAFFETEKEQFLKSIEQLLASGLILREVVDKKSTLRLAQQSWTDFVEEITPPAKAKSIHQHWLHVIEENILEMSNDWVVRLAYHALRSGETEKARNYLPKAADYTRSMFDFSQAVQLYLEYLKLLSREDFEERELVREKLADIYEQQGDFEKSLEIIQDVLKDYEVSKLSTGKIWDWKFRKVDILQKMGRIDDVLNFLTTQHKAWTSLSYKWHAKGHFELGWIYRLKGNFEKAHENYALALDLFKKSSSDADLGYTYNRIGVTYLIQNELDDAEEALVKSLEIFNKISHLRGLAHVHNNLGILYRQKGDSGRALKHYQNCLKIRRATRDISFLPQVLNNLANLQYYEGKWREAFEAYQEVLKVSQGLGLLETTASVLDNLGMLSLYFGHIDEALLFGKKAVLLNRELGNLRNLAIALERIGDIYDVKEEFHLSKNYYRQSLKYFEKLKNETASVIILVKLGSHYLKMNKKEAALDYFIRAEDLCQIHHLEPERVQVAIYILKWALQYHDFQRGEYYRSFLQNNLAVLSDPYLLGLAHRQLGDALFKKEQPSHALENYQKALEIFNRLSAVIEQARTHKAIALTHNLREDFEQAQVHLKKAVQLFERIPARSERLRFMQHLVDVQEHLIANLQQGSGSDNQIIALQQTSLIIHSIFSLETMLHNIMNTVINLLKADRAAIIFVDKTSGGLEVKVNRGMEDATIEDALRISQSIVERVEQTGNSVLSRDTRGDDRFRNSKSVRNFRIFSLMCVPLKLEDHLIGTVYIDSRNPDRIFTYRDLEFLENIADLAAVAISNSEYYEDLKNKKDTLEKDVKHLREAMEKNFKFNNMIGSSKPMQEIFKVVSKVLDKNVDILIRGESGTGKEKLAGIIHFNSNRKDKPFVTVNCAAIPPTLLESELFGIEKRVATGVDMHIGKFEQADGGTIFLDEIGDMSMDTQAKILRVVQEREFQRIGGSKTIKVDVRIIAATNKNLEEAMQNKTFRQDLYYRLNVLPIVIPPLRERREDIPLLVEFFMKKYGPSGFSKKITNAAMKALVEYDWPGNVRELENVIHRMMIFTENGHLTGNDLPVEIRAKNKIQEIIDSGKGGMALKDYERTLLVESLKLNEWNISKTAKTLGVHRNTLHRKLKAYQIAKPKL